MRDMCPKFYGEGHMSQLLPPPRGAGHRKGMAIERQQTCQSKSFHGKPSSRQDDISRASKNSATAHRQQRWRLLQLWLQLMRLLWQWLPQPLWRLLMVGLGLHINAKILSGSKPIFQSTRAGCSQYSAVGSGKIVRCMCIVHQDVEALSPR